jgi:hypothetical protein
VWFGSKPSYGIRRLLCEAVECGQVRPAAVLRAVGEWAGALMSSKDSRRWRARPVPMIAIAIAGLLAVSAWSTPNQPGHRLPGRSQTPFFADVAALNGVSALSRTNAWAVGSYVASHESQLTLTENWNGRSWRQVPSPSPGGKGGYSQLDAVSAISAKNAWAVGNDGTSKGGPNCLTEHWNGSRWTAVPDASHGLLQCELNAVTTISASDAWAVGTYLQLFPGHDVGAILTLIEHWNGTSWLRVASPNPGGDSPGTTSELTGVTAASPRDAWAVGDYDPDFPATLDRTLIEHWNGSRWATVPSPSPGFPDNNSGLDDVAATSTSAWAAGGSAAPFTLRLVHGRWHEVAIPGKHQMLKNLTAIAVTSASSVWAVGAYGLSGQQPWIVHWNGSRWATTPAPFRKGSTVNTSLVAVTAPSPAATWAVGSVGQTNMASVTLIEHWTGTKWVTVPSPSP